MFVNHCDGGCCDGGLDAYKEFHTAEFGKHILLDKTIPRF